MNPLDLRVMSERHVAVAYIKDHDCEAEFCCVEAVNRILCSSQMKSLGLEKT